jgi:hypothetical protein
MSFCQVFLHFFEGTSKPDGTPFKYGTNEDHESMQRRVTSFYNTSVAWCEIHPEVGVKQPEMGRKKASLTSDAVAMPAKNKAARPFCFHLGQAPPPGASNGGRHVADEGFIIRGGIDSCHDRWGHEPRRFRARSLSRPQKSKTHEAGETPALPGFRVSQWSAGVPPAI